MNLNQVTVPSLDLTKAVPFYVKLGLKLIVESLPDYTRFECPDGHSTFSIHRTDSLPEGAGIAVYFECIDLDNTLTNSSKKELNLTKNQQIRNGSGEKHD